MLSAIPLCLVAGAIAPIAVHTVPSLRQLTEHPLAGLTQVYAARPDNNGNLYLVRADAEIMRLTDTKATEVVGILSPDGRQVAYSSNLEGTYDLYLMTLDDNDRSSGIRRLTSLSGDEIARSWSPDGSGIVFDSVVEKSVNVMTIHPDGTGMAALTTDGVSFGGAWSPDGTLLAYSHPDDTGQKEGIWTMQPDGTDRRLVVQIGGNDFDPMWSPDGARILFTGDSSGSFDVWVADANGQNARDLTYGWKDADIGVGWGPHDVVIFASDRSHTGGNFIYAMQPDGSDVRLVVII